MSELASRAMRIAEAARETKAPQLEFEWWTVTRADGTSFEVFMCPAATNADMLARYPRCGVLPVKSA